MGTTARHLTPLPRWLREHAHKETQTSRLMHRRSRILVEPTMIGQKGRAKPSAHSEEVFTCYYETALGYRCCYLCPVPRLPPPPRVCLFINTSFVACTFVSVLLLLKFLIHCRYFLSKPPLIEYKTNLSCFCSLIAPCLDLCVSSVLLSTQPTCFSP
jgi:hypothetical protein